MSSCPSENFLGFWHFDGVTFYQRHLPHWHPQAAPIFLTWRLFGSVVGKADSLPTEGQRFVARDRSMDLADSGPLWLK